MTTPPKAVSQLPSSLRSEGRRAAGRMTGWTVVLLSALLIVPCCADNSRFTPIQSIFQSLASQRPKASHRKLENDTSLQAKRNGPTPEQIAKEREARRQRQLERNARVKDAMKAMRPSEIERVDKEEVDAMADKHGDFRRNLWGGSGGVIEYLDPGQDYDMWSQAYRMLGGFIDCDHKKDEGDSHDNNDNNGEVSKGCSRWMMWAAYVDPNYQGYGYYEYHGEEPVGSLDCHVPESDWVLLGVYRQEFYQFIEQISKHLWRIDEYEYIVALAGLAYMTDYDCFYVGVNNSGNYIYAGVAPQKEGKFEMALYTDDDCLVPDENLISAGATFDDYQLYSDVKLESGDEGGGGDDDNYQYIYETWTATQEYKLEMLNDVYESFQFCTSCIDYPTYQDGYYIGDTGTDDDDLINQCWKFYSHDSFTCESDCIALGHTQGTILSVEVGGVVFGTVLSEFLSGSGSNGVASTTETSFSRLVANAFVTFSFIVFIATFLAFAVARRSRYRESRSARSRRLLDDDRQARSRARRSKSRSKRGEGDGLFRDKDDSRKGRSKSGSRRSKSKSNRSRSSRRRTSEGRERDRSRDKNYEPPSTTRSSSRRRASSKGRGEGEAPPDEF